MFRPLFTFIVATLSAVAAIAMRAVDYALTLMAPLAPPLDLGSFPRLALDTGFGEPIDAATFQANRHEAGVRRRSADRNI